MDALKEYIIKFKFTHYFTIFFNNLDKKNTAGEIKITTIAVEIIRGIIKTLKGTENKICTQKVFKKVIKAIAMATELKQATKDVCFKLFLLKNLNKYPTIIAAKKLVNVKPGKYAPIGNKNAPTTSAIAATIPPHIG